MQHINQEQVFWQSHVQQEIGSSFQLLRQPTVYWCWGAGLLLLLHQYQQYRLTLCCALGARHLLSGEAWDLCREHQHGEWWGHVWWCQCLLPLLPGTRTFSSIQRNATSFQEVYLMTQHVCSPHFPYCYEYQLSSFQAHTYPRQCLIWLHAEGVMWCMTRIHPWHKLIIKCLGSGT